MTLVFIIGDQITNDRHVNFVSHYNKQIITINRCTFNKTKFTQARNILNQSDGRIISITLRRINPTSYYEPGWMIRPVTTKMPEFEYLPPFLRFLSLFSLLKIGSLSSLPLVKSPRLTSTSPA